ncbi:hypothetical protein [Alloalcanivorax gelatiniphagus]|uniref:DUF2846 domain-containing protein n=1 Tax=Alloalcanivorax gelatiniphagus TaxID=1194167 RepID=A0ABY2XQR8_9GAMM|nr:hypothetical protein [Alloalcanivorax gelatiniphagus]TMW14085.1 hypothetical protein FGS76_03910 [Alloalcanivorax gelatiniphagus]
MRVCSAVLLLALAMAVTGCTGTALYEPPGDGAPKARLSIETMFGGNGERGAGESIVAMLKVDGERLAETGGKQRVFLEPGEHSVAFSADHQGTLRFGTLSHDFQAGADYLIWVGEGEGDRPYSAVLVPAGSGVVNIYDETLF